MNGTLPEVGARIRWTGLVTYSNRWIFGPPLADHGHIEILADPEPTVPGTVVRDANGALWVRAMTGKVTLDWLAVERATGMWNTWDGIPQPVEVLFIPEEQKS